MVSRLAERPISEQLNQKIFPTYKALMCFAACLGFERGEEEDIADPVDFVDSRVIERDADCMDLIYLIGLAKSRDGNILKDGPETEAQLANVFERFAEGGLGVLQQWMRETPSDAYGYSAIITALHKHGCIAAPAIQGTGEEPDF